MADQDLDINIRTVADLTGVRKAADAIAILDEQAKKSQAEAVTAGKGGADEATKFTEHIGKGLERAALHAVGVGLIYEAINAIKQTAQEINKITEALDKQGEALLKNSMYMIEQSRYAKSDADVLKIAEEGMKNIAAAHKTVTDLQQKELSTWEKIADLNYKANPLTPPGAMGPNEARLEEQRTAALLAEQKARETAMRAIATAETLRERDAARSLTDTIADLNKQLAHEQELMAKSFTDKDIEGYLKHKQAIKELTNELDYFIKIHEKAIEQTQKQIQGASPQVQAILKNIQAGNTATAEAFKRGATPGQLKELEQFQQREKPPGRAAGFGESQEVVDNIERNRIAFEKMQKEGLVDSDKVSEVERNRVNFERQMQGKKPLEEEKKDAAGKAGQHLNPDVVEAINRLADLWK